MTAPAADERAAYYNEIDPKAAAWLRGLIAEGLIAPGVVDERSIADVRPADLAGFRQVHLFAGVGGWSLALRLAGVPDDAPVWTGSCPCQPFSVAGRGRGVDDERHLWPAMRELVRECRPPVVVGEQVASAAGRGWLASVRADLEDLGYAVGAADLCAAGVGAPHIRQRLYWGAVGVADRDGIGLGPWARSSGQPSGVAEPHGLRPPRGLGDAGRERRDGVDPLLRAEAAERLARAVPQAARAGIGLDAWRDHGWVECADGRSRPTAPLARRVDDGVPARVGLLRGYGNAIVPQLAAAFVTSLLGVADP